MARRPIFRLVVLACPLIAAGLVVTRYVILLHNAKAIIEVSHKFPTEFVVGAGTLKSASLVILGDSTAFGTGASSIEHTLGWTCASALSRSGRRVDVHNFAVVGARLADVVDFQLPRVSKLRAEYVLVSIGANDVTHFTDSGVYAGNLTLLLRSIETAKAVWILSTPNMRYPPAIPAVLSSCAANRADSQNEDLERTKRTASIHIVNIFREGILDPAVNPDYYAADQFHPSDEGYAVWNGVVDRSVRETMERGG